MDRSSLNFLYGANIKTATEAALRASQVASQVSALTRNKIFSVRSILSCVCGQRIAAKFDQLTPESGIAINDSLISRPLDASEIAQLVNLYSQGLLSKRTVLDELQRGGILDPDLRVEEEIERTELDHQELVDQEIDDELARQEAVAASTESQTPVPDQSGEPIDIENPESAQAAASRQQ